MSSDQSRTEEIEALLHLDALPEVGPRTVLRLVDRFGSARAALAAPPGAVRGWMPARALELRTDPAIRAGVREGLRRCAQGDVRVVGWSDAAYPPSLRGLTDPPPVLFLKGREDPPLGDAVAVVGSRRATARGRDVAFALGRALAARGVPVVSGLARGVDAAAHRGALAADGPTVAVLGSGPERAYPASHAHLYRDIVERGLVVSEFLPGTPALPHHFPRRNRILAALASQVVVVEAGARSGALITVDHALDLGLEVYAVPGPIDSPSCRGSNALLVDGARALVSVEEFAERFVGEASDPNDPPVPTGLPEPDRRVLEAVLSEPLSADAIAGRAGLPVERALACLTALEVAGRVERRPGAQYRRAG